MTKIFASAQQADNILYLDKKALRAEMRSRRRSLSPEQKKSFSLAAQKHILDSTEWRQARSVALYMALPEETDSAALLRDAWQSGKNVLLPLCSSLEEGRMDFFACAGMHELRPGIMGILEPDLQAIAHRLHGNNLAVKPDSPGSSEAYRTLVPPAPPPELIIVPGVAFDRKGLRLGMGGGYYDRLFARPEYVGCLRIGLAFAFQVVASLPGEAWDLPIHGLSTEKGLLWIHNT